jgi:hypothetical protein
MMSSDGTRSVGAVRDGRPRDRHLPGHRAPRELVFEAFTEVRHLSRWWGPEGFTTTTRRSSSASAGCGTS